MSLISKECVELVKEFEGFYAKAYKCPAGVWTIGYGTTNSKYVNKGTCTKEEATVWLMEEMNEKSISLKADLSRKGVSLKQNEFDALASMAYNIGTSGMINSTLYKNVVAGIRDKSIITNNFMVWNKHKKNNVLVESAGLTRRRKAEAELFFKNVAKVKNTDYQERYVKLFQEFYNVATKTTTPLIADGKYGPATKQAYDLIGKLIGGTY